MENMTITLAAARVNRGFTQDQAAQALHVAKSTVSAWERGNHVPNTKHVAAILAAYGVSIDNLTFKGRHTPAPLA